MIDQDQISQAVTSILDAIGEDTEREGLAETPRRVAELFSEFFSGLDQDPSKVLETGFDNNYGGLVAFSICEHHLLPFIGTASIGYLPGNRVVGASKIMRALDILARRPQMQERLTTHLADAIAATLEPKGVGVVISAEHLCMTLRGVKEPGNRMITSAYRGEFESNVDLRHEFWSMTRSS